MRTGSRASFVCLCAVPVVAIGLAAAHPLHDLPGHGLIGGVLFCVALLAAWRLGGPGPAPATLPVRIARLAGLFLLAPWMLILLLWVGLGAPFQAGAVENQHRYALLLVNAALVGAGFLLLRSALQEAGEKVLSNVLFAAAVPATALYTVSIAITLAQASWSSRAIERRSRLC